MVANIIVAAVVLFHALQLPSMSKGQALQWQVNKTSEIIFGQSEMELICSGTACCTGAVRRWTEEPSATILMSNGVPSDPTKYEEILKTNSFSLIFKTLELADVNLQYMCTIDFDDSLATLLLPTADVFRYVPDSSEIEIERNLTGSNIYLTANLTRVFPEPTCTAILEESNITSSLVLTTYDNTPVKFTIIEMNNIPYQCSNGRGNLFISCYVGSIKFTVIQEELCVRTSTLIPTTKQPPDQKCFFGFIDASETLCIIIFVVVMALIVGIVLLLIYCILQCRKRNKGNEAGIVLEEQHLNETNKSKASERYDAKEEIIDGKSSEEITKEGEGNGNQSISTHDEQDSNSFTNETSVNKPKTINEITQYESDRNTDM